MEILGSIYTEVSEKFQNGILKGEISRCIKAEKHDLGVVMAEVKQIGNIAEEKKFSNPQTGRNPDDPLDRTAGSPTEQRLEPNTQGISNRLTSVQKDNLVMEKTILQRARGFNMGGEHKICPPITANSFQDNNLLKCQYRIRKLTPRECGRLMGVSDEDISKMAAVNSNTQLYKQFGNSIVVDVMCAMFRNLNINQ